MAKKEPGDDDQAFVTEVVEQKPTDSTASTAADSVATGTGAADIAAGAFVGAGRGAEGPIEP